MCALYDLRESTTSETPPFRHSTATQFVDRHPTNPINNPLVRVSLDGSSIACLRSPGSTEFLAIPRSSFPSNVTSSMRSNSSHVTSAPDAGSSPADNSWNTAAQGWSTGQSPQCLDVVHSIDCGDIIDLAFCPGSSLVVTVDTSSRLCWFLPKN